MGIVYKKTDFEINLVDRENKTESDNEPGHGKLRWQKIVPLKRRLTYLAVIVVSFTFFCYVHLDNPISRTANGSHIITIKKPGDYVAFFTGDVRDPFGWHYENGIIRKSLEVDILPVSEKGKAVKLPGFKDISQASLFSVAEFEIYEPGDYLLNIKWKDFSQQCEGDIFLEQDVVEKFFYKWASGIACVVAFLGILGFPINRGGY